MTDATESTAATDAPVRTDGDHGNRRTFADAVADQAELRRQAEAVPDRVEAARSELYRALRRARILAFEVELRAREIEVRRRVEGIDAEVPPVPPPDAEAMIGDVKGTLNAITSPNTTVSVRRDLELVAALADATDPDCPPANYAGRRVGYIDERVRLLSRGTFDWPSGDLADLVAQARSEARRLNEEDQLAGGGGE